MNTEISRKVAIVLGPDDSPIFRIARIINGMLKHSAVIPIGKPSGKNGNTPFVTWWITIEIPYTPPGTIL